MDPGPSPVEAEGRLPEFKMMKKVLHPSRRQGGPNELKMMKGVWSSKKQARRSVEFKCCTRLSFVEQGQVKTPARGGL